jgi:alpha-ribazole phosphatase
MIRFWWVRHGPTHEKNLVGWRDVPADLSDHPRIARLSAHLPMGAHLVSSDLARASATADALTRGRHRLPDMPALREFHFGDWDGKHFSELDPTHSRAYWDNPGDISPPNGESWNDAAARVHAAVDTLTGAIPQGDIIIVAHAGVIVTQVQRALGITPFQALGHKIDNLSVTQLVLTPAGWRAAVINHIP